MGHLTLWLKIELSPKACKHVSTETLTAVVWKKKCRNFTSGHVKCKRFYRFSCQRPGFLLNPSGPRTIFFFLAVAEILSAAPSQSLTAAAREKACIFWVPEAHFGTAQHIYTLELPSILASQNSDLRDIKSLWHPGIKKMLRCTV